MTFVVVTSRPVDLCMGVAYNQGRIQKGYSLGGGAHTLVARGGGHSDFRSISSIC